GTRYFLSSSTTTIPTDREGPFDVVISACGRGIERTWLGQGEQPTDFAGFQFWQNDPIEKFNYGAGGFPYRQTKTVIISGGGDGAMQDLLRSIFSNPNYRQEAFNPGDLLNALKESVRNTAGE